MQKLITPLLIVTLAVAAPTTRAATQRVSAQTFIEALRAHESQEALDALLAQGVDAQTQHEATTALIEAVKTNHYAALALLAAPHHMLNINACDQDGNTALHHAVKSKSTNLISALLATKKINPNARNNREITPIMLAAQQADLETVRALFKTGAHLDASDNAGTSVLEYALLGIDQAPQSFATRKAKMKRFSTVSFIYYRLLSVPTAAQELMSAHPVYAALLEQSSLSQAEQAIRQGKKLAGQAWQAVTSKPVVQQMIAKAAQALAAVQTHWNALPPLNAMYNSLQERFAQNVGNNAAEAEAVQPADHAQAADLRVEEPD